MKGSDGEILSSCAGSSSSGDAASTPSMSIQWSIPSATDNTFRPCSSCHSFRASPKVAEPALEFPCGAVAAKVAADYFPLGVVSISAPSSSRLHEIELQTPSRVVQRLGDAVRGMSIYQRGGSAGLEVQQPIAPIHLEEFLLPVLHHDGYLRGDGVRRAFDSVRRRLSIGRSSDYSS